MQFLLVVVIAILLIFNISFTSGFIPIPQPKLILVKGNLVSLAAKTRVAPSKTHAVRNGNENVTDEATKNASNHNLHLPFAVDHRKTGERPNNLPVDCNAAITTCTFSVLLLLLWSVTPLPAEAITSSTGVVPSALYAYGHFFSIMVITGCLAAERLLVKEGMTVEDENLIVKLDLVYGLMAALLIISGVLRANMNGERA